MFFKKRRKNETCSTLTGNQTNANKNNLYLII